MKIVTSHYVELSEEDKAILACEARDIDQGLSETEFTDKVELMLNRAVDLFKEL